MKVSPAQIVETFGIVSPEIEMSQRLQIWLYLIYMGNGLFILIPPIFEVDFINFSQLYVHSNGFDYQTIKAEIINQLS